MSRRNSWKEIPSNRKNSNPVLFFLIFVAVFICAIQIFPSVTFFQGENLPPPYNPQYIRCKSMNLSKERIEAPFGLEGIHYPNQTYYLSIVESPPDDLIIRSPLISNKTEIIIVVGSKNYEQEARVQIRRSWAHRYNPYIMNKTVTVIFAVGNNREDRECLLKEADRFQDLLIVDAADSYRGLVYKMLMAYRFLAAHFKKSHIVKIAKDTILDINQFMKFMAKQNSTPAVYGYIFWSSAPQREPGGKWYVPKDVFPDESFPAYSKGNLYVMTKTAFSAVMKKESLLKAKVIELEDVFFTGIMTKAANVSVHWLDDFSLPAVETNRCPTESQKKLFATCIYYDKSIEKRYNEFMDFKERFCPTGSQ